MPWRWPPRCARCRHYPCLCMDQLPAGEISWQRMGLLVLSGCRDQRIEILVPPSDQPTLIVETIIDIRGDKVRLGYEAPRTVRVDRAEVAAAIRAEQGSDAGLASAAKQHQQ